MWLVLLCEGEGLSPNAFIINFIINANLQISISILKSFKVSGTFHGSFEPFQISFGVVINS